MSDVYSPVAPDPQESYRGWQRYLGQPADTSFTLKGDNLIPEERARLQPPQPYPPPPLGSAVGGLASQAIFGGLSGLGSDIKSVGSLDPSSMVRGLGGLGMAAMGPGPEAKAGKSLLETGLSTYAKHLPEEFKGPFGELKTTVEEPHVTLAKGLKHYQESLGAGKITPAEYSGFSDALWKQYGGATAAGTPKPQGKSFGEMSPQEFEAWEKGWPAPKKEPAQPSSWMLKPGAPTNYFEWVNAAGAKGGPPLEYQKFQDSLSNAEWKDFHATTKKWAAEEPSSTYYKGKPAELTYHPTGTMEGDLFIHQGGKKIGEITAPDTKGDPFYLWMNHWGDQASAKQYSTLAEVKTAAKEAAEEVPTEQVPHGFTGAQWAKVTPEAKKIVTENPHIDWAPFAALSAPKLGPATAGYHLAAEEGKSAMASPIAPLVSPSKRYLPGRSPADYLPAPPEKATQVGFNMPMRHGGYKEFEQFAFPEHVGFGGREPELGVHAGTPRAAEDRVGKPLEGGNVHYDLIGRAQNPLRMKDLGSWGEDNVKSELKHLGFPKGEVNDLEGMPAVRDYIASKGYDSIVYRNYAEDPGSDSYLFFKPSKDDPRYVQGIRKRGAAFDPSKVEMSNIMAGLGGGAVLPWLGGGDAQRK